ncbi:hypothetical protein OIU76_008366 [Salix suchowensis]|nr:hypothetical protein OIU76_008366 [Salix suchowensis]
MATTPSPMASQLKSSFSSSLARRPAIPTAISGAPFRVSPSKRSFTVKAIQSEKPTYQVVQPIKWRSLHRKPRDSRHIKPADCMVPVKSARLQDSSEPASPRNRGWTCPWLPPGRSICQGWSTEEHRVCRCSWVSGRRWSGCDTKHLPDHVWSRIIHRRRAIHRPRSNLDWKEEGA